MRVYARNITVRVKHLDLTNDVQILSHNLNKVRDVQVISKGIQIEGAYCFESFHDVTWRLHDKQLRVCAACQARIIIFYSNISRISPRIHCIWKYSIGTFT